MHRWKVFAALGWSLVGLTLLAAAPRKDVVRTSRLAIYDEWGHDRIILEMIGKQPSVVLLDDAGRTRLALWLGDEGSPVVKLASDDEKRKVVLMVPETGSPKVDVSSVNPDRTTDNRTLSP